MSFGTIVVRDRDATTVPINRRKSSITNSHTFNSKANDHEEKLTLAVEQGLSVLGETVSQTIFYNLEKKYSLKKPDILKKPDRFIEALKDMFDSGAATIERLIIRSICARTGLEADKLKDYTLSHCIKQARRILNAK